MSSVILCVQVSYDKFVLCRICFSSKHCFLLCLITGSVSIVTEEWLFIKHVHLQNITLGVYKYMEAIFVAWEAIR